MNLTHSLPLIQTATAAFTHYFSSMICLASATTHYLTDHLSRNPPQLVHKTQDINLLWLLVIFIACGLLSLTLCGIARALFPKFRSGEFKPGPHRFDILDHTSAGREIKTIELPLVGGPAFMLAIMLIGIGAGFFLQFSSEQWTLLLIGLGATAGYTIIGFIDDWHKVFSKEGISERTKLGCVLFVSMAAALLYYLLLKNGKEPYSPYTDLAKPIFDHFPFIWLPFLMLLTGVIGSVTSLSVDFSDGLDGLAGGLVFSAALAFGIVITGIVNGDHPDGIVLEVLSLLCASAALGYLPWNWPSSWAARRTTAKRRARIYMGDSGSLGLGGMLAMMAIFSRQETLLLMIGGTFVLEGLSALVQGRLLTRFFRKQLRSLRFASSRAFEPHTEFPLPFLATPLHHHFDLLGWDRRRLVYGAWALGAVFALLGVLVGLDTVTWQRWVGRFLVLILGWLVWSSGSWTRRYFVGKYPAESTRRGRLALFYGYPYDVMGIPLYHWVEFIEASEDVIETPAEELVLWQRMNIYDARAMLGLYCYRAGYYPAAQAQWNRIPPSNRALRPTIAHLLNELERRLALEEQETQPMRRDQILHQPPIITGNLPPADLPNPHEPIRSEETMNPHAGSWSLSQPYAFAEAGDEEAQFNVPTQGLTLPPSNGHMDTLNNTVATTTRQTWLSRLFRSSSARRRSN